MSRSGVRWLVGVVLVGGLLAGCGSDEESGEDTSPASVAVTTQAPVSTEAPASSATEAPVVTEAPAVTEAPVTDPPAVTEVPESSAAPESSAPVSTEVDLSTVGEGRTIKVGGIFTRTTSPDLDLGAFEAVDAFFQDLNAQGGVNGYMFSFEGIDDQGDPAKFAAAVERLAGEEVDFIISPSATEIAGGLAQLQASGIPYIGGGGYGRDVFATENVFPVGSYFQNSVAKVLEVLLIDKAPAKVSLTVLNHPSTALFVETITTNLTGAGIEVAQTGSIEMTDTDFTGVAAQIIGTGADDAVIVALTGQTPSVVAALEQQGYEGSIYTSAYDASFPEVMGDYVDGRFYTALSYAPLGAGDRGEQAAAIVAEHYPDIELTAMRKGMDAWTAAEVLVEGVRQLGAEPLSHEASIAALNTLTEFETTFMAPITYQPGPDGHLDPANCIQALVIEDGQWTTPTNDRFTCWQGTVAPT